MKFRPMGAPPEGDHGGLWRWLVRLVAELARKVNWGTPTVFDVQDYGAVPDGVTDSTLFIQRAIDAAAAAGGANGAEVFFPPGTYLISGNPFYNRIAQGNCPLLVRLSQAVLKTSVQVKLPASTILRGTNRLRCGITANTTYLCSAAITSIALVSNVVTVTTSTPHGYESNATALIQGVVTQTSLNGGWLITSTPSATTFTFAFTHADISDTTGTCYAPIFVLGDQATNTQGVRFENMQVNGADLANSIGVYANAIGEQCGAYNYLVTQCALKGVWLEKHGSSASSGGPNNYFFQNGEVSVTPNVSGTAVYIRSLAALHRGFDNLTTNTSTNTGTSTAGLDISGAPGVYSRIHCEHATDGILLGNRGSASSLGSAKDSAAIILSGVTGEQSITNLIHLKNYGEVHDIVIEGVAAYLSTNSIVDDVAGITLVAGGTADEYVAMYVIGGIPTNTRFSTSPNVPWKIAASLNVAGTMTASVYQGLSNGVGVVIDNTTAKITIDGTDGTVAAGSIGIAENNGSLNLSSRSDVTVMLDNDANSSSQQFAIYHDVTAVSGTPLFKVNEDGGTTVLNYRSSISTPAQLVVNTDNYNPSTAGWLRLSTDASRNLTGVTGGAEGRELWITNVGSFNLVLVEQATSTAANQIITGTGADVTLAPLDNALLKYDNVSARWRIVSMY